jgi:hypothetical protein
VSRTEYAAGASLRSRRTRPLVARWSARLGRALAVAAPLAACDHAPGAPTSAAHPPTVATLVTGDAPDAPADASAARSISPPDAGGPDVSPVPHAKVASLAPLTSPEPLVALAVGPFRDAIVSLPEGATSARPVVVAAHGNYDRPEWQCSVWRGIVGDRAFVLCPRGIPRTDSPAPDDVRFTFAGVEALAREIDAGIAALRVRFGPHVDGGPMLYAGFSLGAILGVPIVARDPSRFPRAVLVEGGHDAWTAAVARTYGTRGGRRVLFACGQPGCVVDAKPAAARLVEASVETRTVLGPGVGHGYGGPVAAEVASALGWLLDDDALWR